jgi:hypothetical protein
VRPVDLLHERALLDGALDEKETVMKRQGAWLKALTVAVATVAIVFGITSLGGRVVAADDLNIKHPPPGGGGCICPTNYDPVVCVAADGSRHFFSNLCVAGCNGYTSAQCARIVTPGE